jgi:tripartite-type tricarboxylate transporter receptor subunit TctC
MYGTSKLISMIAGSILGGLMMAGPILAQGYPAKPVTLVVPFGPGGAVDVVCRVIGDALSKQLGQQFIVDNRPGATGNIAIDYVAHANADGYTLLFSNAIPVVVSPVISDNYPVVVEEAFDAVGIVGDANAYILTVNASMPIKSVAELLKHAASNPGALLYASGGNGSINHLAMELFKTATGADLTHIPYQAGAAAAVNAVLGNETQVMVGGLSATLPHIQSGALRALAVTSDSRAPQLPDVPTLAEAGVTGERFSMWYGVLAPKGTPGDAVAKLNASINKALESTEVRTALDKLGVVPKGGSTADFATIIKSDGQVWQKVAKTANLTGK